VRTPRPTLAFNFYPLEKKYYFFVSCQIPFKFSLFFFFFFNFFNFFSRLHIFHNLHYILLCTAPKSKCVPSLIISEPFPRSPLKSLCPLIEWALSTLSGRDQRVCCVVLVIKKRAKMPLKLAGVATVGSLLLCVAISLFHIAGAEDPYRFFNWNITYGDIYPLGVRQTVWTFSIRINFLHFFFCYITISYCTVCITDSLLLDLDRMVNNSQHKTCLV